MAKKAGDLFTMKTTTNFRKAKIKFISLLGHLPKTRSIYPPISITTQYLA